MSSRMLGESELTTKADEPAEGGRISKDASGISKAIASLRERIGRSRKVIRSVVALLSGNLLASVLGAVGGLLAARFVGPSETGAYRAFTIPLTYLIFLHLGTWDALWHQIPYYAGKEMPGRVDLIGSTAGAFNLLVSIVVSFGLLCCAGHSLVHHDLHGVFGWLSQLVLCWSVFYGGYLTSTYRTLHHFVTLARIQVAQAVLAFGIVFTLPFLKFYGLCARVAFPALLIVLLYHWKRPLRVKYRLNIKALKGLIKLGFPLSFWGNLYTSIWTATESALVLSLAGVTALGLYSVAIVISAAVNTLPMAMWQVITPRVVTAFAKDGSVRRANARIGWVTVGLTGTMVAIVIVTSLLLNIFVPLFIPKYTAGIAVMKVCLWFPVVQAAFLPMNTLFATGRPWLYGRSVIAGIVIFPLAVCLLYPVIGGLLAVAIGSLLGRSARTCAAYVDLIVLTKRGG